jgi:hypothetical protein
MIEQYHDKIVVREKGDSFVDSVSIHFGLGLAQVSFSPEVDLPGLVSALFVTISVWLKSLAAEKLSYQS